MHLHTSCTLAICILVTACGGSDTADTVLYKQSGSLQCAPSQTTQVRLNAEVAALQAAGASVSASSCANDGVAHAALCGAENGDLFAVTVSPGSEHLAVQAGFVSAGNYPGARPLACQ